MALVVANEGEQVALEAMLNKTAPQNLVLKLFTDDRSPLEVDTAASFTEAAGFGYASKALTAANWTVTPGAPSEAAYPEETWTFSGALGNVYGYYVVQTTSNKLMWAERFTGAPFNIQNNGDQIKVTLKITAE